MKLSQRTLNILHLFSRMRKPLVIQQGNFISQINPAGTVKAFAEIEETLPRFNMQDSTAFMSALKTFKNHDDLDFTFSNAYVNVKHNNGELKFKLSFDGFWEENAEKLPLSRPEELDYEADYSFIISAADYAQFMSTARAIGANVLLLRAGEMKAVQCAFDGEWGSFFTHKIEDGKFPADAEEDDKKVEILVPLETMPDESKSDMEIDVYHQEGFLVVRNLTARIEHMIYRYDDDEAETIKSKETK
jgi:hypothetical protein